MLSTPLRAENDALLCVSGTVNNTEQFKRGVSELSYFHVPGKEPLLPLTVGDVIDRGAQLFGDATAFVSCHQNISKTFMEYKEDVDQLAASLLSLELPMGSRVAILAPNLYEVALLSFATAKAGLVMVGLNPFCTLSGMEFSLHKTECVALIVAEDFTTRDYYQMLLEIAPELKESAPGHLKSTRLPYLKHVVTIGATRKPGSVTFDDLMKSAAAVDQVSLSFVSAKVQFDQDAFIQFSSGTTGQPKSVRLTHFNVVNNANLVGRILGYHQQHESICLFRELVFGFGRTLGLLAAVLFGSVIVLPAPSFSAKANLEAISKHRCTVIYGSPTSYIKLLSELDQGEYDVSSLRKGMMAAASCSPELVEKARERLNVQRLYIMYGASETSPNVTSTNPDEPIDEWIRTIGTPMEHVEVKVVDAEGRIVPVNTRGEMCTRGPHVFKGYLNDDEKTKEAIRDGWYHTGDHVTMSKDGRITFIGRIKETINIAGWNVSPLEIESVLNAHEDVEEAQVTGVPDNIMGEKICAWVKLQPGKTSSHEKIKEFCAGKVNDYKVPAYVLFVDSFPRTPSGKVQKHKMRQESMVLLDL